MAIHSEKDFMQHFDSLNPSEQEDLIKDLQKRQAKNTKPPGAPAGEPTDTADLFEK